jgi:hypothetical protein
MRIRGTQNSIPFIEVGKTNVYFRTNVVRIEEEEFSGWEYDEQVIPIQEYINTLADRDSTDTIAMILSTLMQEIDELKSRITVLEG